jgi:TRADD-N domain-containing protein
MADISTILTLLTSGAAATMSAKEFVDQKGIQDSYQKLKELLRKRLEETQDDKKDDIANIVIEKYEEDPVIWRAPLEQELIRANVDQDEQLDEAAQKLAILVTPKDAAYDRIATAANATRQQLERIYEQGRDQAKQWSLFSLVAAIAGFLVIVGGVVAVLTVNTAVGVITSIAGLIPEVAAALFFQQARDANKRVDTISDKLLEVDKIHRAIEIVLTVDGASQDRLKETIVLRILGLSGKE